MEFPPILVINLKEREDRWKEISSQLDELGLPYERVDAVKMEPGWKGCSLSFKKCYEIAKERNYPWVVILEDDCLFQKSGKERFEQLLPLLWQRKHLWDVFTGGSFYMTKACKVLDEPPLFQVKAWSSHFILAHCGSYEKLIREIHENLRVDKYYKEKVRAWCTYPHIAIQRKSYSDLDKRIKNTRHNFKMTDIILKGILEEKDTCWSRKKMKTQIRKTRKRIRY